MTRAASETVDRALGIAVPGPPLLVAVPEDPAVRVVFTRRTDAAGSGNLSLVVGDGDAVGERRAAIAATGADPARAVFMQQVHGGNVATVTAADAGRGLTDHADAIAGVDALVTTAVDIPLAVLVADCVPVILVAPGHGVAAVHAGRGGVGAEVVAAALGRLAPTAGASQVVALIGPAIGGCCYEVPAAMADDVARRWPSARATTTRGTPSVDLPAAVEAQLADAGVARVQRVGSCTRCSLDALFSHRAAGAGLAPHGRQAGIVVRTSGSASGAPAAGAGTPSLQSP